MLEDAIFTHVVLEKLHGALLRAASFVPSEFPRFVELVVIAAASVALFVDKIAVLKVMKAIVNIGNNHRNKRHAPFHDNRNTIATINVKAAAVVRVFFRSHVFHITKKVINLGVLRTNGVRIQRNSSCHASHLEHSLKSRGPTYGMSTH